MKKTLILTPLVMLLLLTSNIVLAGRNTTTVVDPLVKCALASDKEVTDEGLTCCSKSVGVCNFCDGEGDCHTGPYIPAGKIIDNTFNAPTTSGTTLAPIINPPAVKPIKPSVIAPSNRVLTVPTVTTPSNKAFKKPSLIVPNNRVLPKSSVISPSNRTIKNTTTRSINSAVGTSADREASKPSIVEIKKTR